MNTYDSQGSCQEEAEEVEGCEPDQPPESLVESVQHSESEHERLPDEREVPEHETELEAELDAREHEDPQDLRQVGVVVGVQLFTRPRHQVT